MPFAPVTGGSSQSVLYQAGAQRGQLLGSLLTQFLGQKDRDAEKAKSDAQKAAALRKSISLYAPEMKDQVNAMGLGDLEGVVGGLNMQRQQADANRSDRYLKLQEDQFGQAQKQREAQGRFGQLLAQYAAQPADLGTQFATGTAGLEQPGGLNVERYLQAAGEAGVMPSDRLLDQFITQSQRGSGLDGTPQPFSAGGMSGVYSPRTGQFQVERTAPSELTPAQKQQYISSLRGRRVQLLGDLNKSVGTEEDKALLREELAILDEELMGLGAKVSAPKPAGGGGGKAVGRFNPQTGKFERY